MTQIESSPIEGCIGRGLIGSTLIGVEREDDSLMVGIVPQRSQLTLQILIAELLAMCGEYSALDQGQIESARRNMVFQFRHFFR